MSTDFGVTLPSKILQKLDDIRGDIPRSRFLLRLVERALKEQEREGEEKLFGAHSSVGSPEERQTVATTNPQWEEGGGNCSNG
jgi:metal-responsive CopG/Arc/MetJ family transcriptional regulator